MHRKTNPVAAVLRERAGVHVGTTGVTAASVRMGSTWGFDGPCDRQIDLERGDPAP
jgi:hypothetical protein